MATNSTLTFPELQHLSQYAQSPQELAAVRQAAIDAARHDPCDLAPLCFTLPSGGPMVPEYFHRDWLRLLTPPEQPESRRVLLLAAREHAKSTYASGVLPLYLLGRNPRQRILLVTAVEDVATKFMRELRMKLTHPAFRTIFPAMPAIERANDDELYFATDVRDPAFRVASIASRRLTGSRADLILCDDVCVDENSDTPKKREDLRRRFIEVLLPLLEEPYGSILAVGTPWAQRDLYWSMEHELGFLTHRAPAVDATGTILWPSKFTAEKLDAIKRPDPVAYTKNYLVQIASYSGNVFQREWFVPTVTDVPRLTEVWVSTDTAISKEANADKTTFVTVGRDAQGTIYVLHADHGKWSPAETKQQLTARYQAAHAKYGTAFLGFLTEDIKENRVFADWLRESGARVTLMAHGQLSKAERARAIVPLAQNNTIRLLDAPWNDTLLAELTAFSNDNSHEADDYVDALVYGAAKLTNISFTPHKAPGTMRTITPGQPASRLAFR